jgi:hypothetical protein
MGMSTVMDQVSTCSTFARLNQYYVKSSLRWTQVTRVYDPTSTSTSGSVTRRDWQEAQNAKSRASEMLSRHALECPICRGVHP